jgi:hypothetical protein
VSTPPAQRLSARQSVGSLHPSGRSHAPTPRACVRIAPDRPSVAGASADRRFGSGHQTPQKSTSGMSIKAGQLQGRSLPRRLTTRGRFCKRSRPAKRAGFDRHGLFSWLTIQLNTSEDDRVEEFVISASRFSSNCRHRTFGIRSEINGPATDKNHLSYRDSCACAQPLRTK